MRYIVMLLAVLVGFSFLNVGSAVGKTTEKAKTSSQREVQDSSKRVEARINAKSEKATTPKEKNPFYQERQTYPSDRNFSDKRIKSPFQH